MTQEIIEMSKQAGLTSIDKKSHYLRDCLLRFAQLVAEDEREACAKVCEEVGEHPSLTPRHCAESIRARGKA